MGLPIGIGRDAGTVEVAGFVCFGVLDYERLVLTPVSAIRRIL